jgi:DNA-binding CsgD family transcriptional regulator
MAPEADNNIIQLANKGSDFAGLISRSTTEYELFAICDQLCSTLNLPYYLISTLPNSDGSDNLASISIASNWPSQMVLEFDKNELLNNSPIFRHLSSSTEPYLIRPANQGADKLNDEELLTESIFINNKIIEGVFYSVHLADGQVGSVSFCGETMVLSSEQLQNLNQIAQLIFSRLFVLKNQEGHYQFDLSQREIDCLLWMSKGKTNEEVAEIFQLSEILVRHYTESAMRKLKTRSIVHAVSKALRLKLIT